MKSNAFRLRVYIKVFLSRVHVFPKSINLCNYFLASFLVGIKKVEEKEGSTGTAPGFFLTCKADPEEPMAYFSSGS